MVKLAFLVVLVAGCVRGDYRCETDADCDVGTKGRCETNHRCTVADPECPLERRYAELTGSLANQCYDDAREPLNVCAAGQPPAPRTGCFATVCDRLATCCDTGWSEPCVELAQLHCEADCGLAMAVNVESTVGFTPTLVQLRGDEWRVEPIAAKRFLEYLPPVAGDTRPRLAHLADNELDVVIDGVTIPMSAIEPPGAPTDGVNYRSVTMVDHDRTGRNRVLLSRQEAARTMVELDLDVDGQLLRAQDLGDGLDFVAGGDLNGDPYPDFGAWVGNSYRTLVVNPTDPVSIREELVLPLSSDTLTPALRMARPTVWVDLNDDGRLDLVAAGSQLRVFLAGALGIPREPLPPLDCLDLAPGYEQTPNATADNPVVVPCTTTFFVAAAMPRRDGPTELVVGTYVPAGARSTPTLARMRLTAEGRLELVQTIDLAGCPLCSGILALLTRDLDGDRELDIVAIDAKLRLIVAKSSESYLARDIDPSPLPYVLDSRLRDVRISPTGLTSP